VYQSKAVRSPTAFDRLVPAPSAPLRLPVARLIQSSTQTTAGVRSGWRLRPGSAQSPPGLALISQGIARNDGDSWRPSRRLDYGQPCLNIPKQDIILPRLFGIPRHDRRYMSNVRRGLPCRPCPCWKTHPVSAMWFSRSYSCCRGHNRPTDVRNPQGRAALAWGHATKSGDSPAEQKLMDRWLRRCRGSHCRGSESAVVFQRRYRR
jgi:hypothetical protein